MLSTQETVSGLRKILTIFDGAVKAFPQYTHKQIAEKLVSVYGDTLAELAKDIEASKAAGKNPWQKVKSHASLSKYEAIMYSVTDMIEEQGKTYVAPVVQPVAPKPAKAKGKAKATVAKPVIVETAAPAVRPVALLAHVTAKAA